MDSGCEKPLPTPWSKEKNQQSLPWVIGHTSGFPGVSSAQQHRCYLGIIINAAFKQVTPQNRDLRVRVRASKMCFHKPGGEVGTV